VKLVEHRRGAGDRGAVMAEAALLTPLFIAFIFAILEFGGLFRAYLTLNNATSAATRQAAISGDDVGADHQILQAIGDGSRAIRPDQILHIAIYKAADATTPVPATCAAGTPVNGSCNTYTGADLALPATDFGCSVSPPQPDRFWCPTTRKTAATGANGPPDWLGVFIEIRHPWVTGLFGSEIVISNTSVVKLEASSLV
jgi:hypothetical protein